MNIYFDVNIVQPLFYLKKVHNDVYKPDPQWYSSLSITPYMLYLSFPAPKNIFKNFESTEKSCA